MENVAVYEKEMAQENFNQEKIIKLSLIRSGIKCDHSGFAYLVQAVKEVVADSNLLNNLKSLFTIVAEKCGAKSFFRVEANIHNAIAHTYKNRSFDYINQIYGMEVLKPDHKPTTAEFIRLIAEYYTLELYKNEFKFT